MCLRSCVCFPGQRNASVALDARIIEFKSGGLLTVVVNNVALQFVHHYPWVNQTTIKFPMSSSLSNQEIYDTASLEKPYWKIVHSISINALIQHKSVVINVCHVRLDPREN